VSEMASNPARGRRLRRCCASQVLKRALQP
jgi:hypothetical protein